jgi:hypothetical protein
MTIELLSGSEDAHVQWDHFVEKSNNGTVFHSLRFLGYHDESRFQHHHICFHKRGSLIGVMPAAIQMVGGRTCLVSHPGASFGGPVLPGSVSYEDQAAMVESLCSHALSLAVHKIGMTLPPIPYMSQADQTLEFVLANAGFLYRKREFTSVVSLDLKPEDVFQSLPQKTRADVRQAQNLGLRVAWTTDPSDDDLASMYVMLLENRADLDLDTPPTHSLEELRVLRERLPGMLHLGVVYSGNRGVASTLVFQCSKRALLTFYICHDRSARDLHPVHLMLYDLICEGTRNGFCLLDFGISSIDMKPLSSLIRFKESFRSHGFLRDTFEKQIDPT